jgi:hypothetical protein
MPSTTGHSFGDVVLVPFPFPDQSGVKTRLAVVVLGRVPGRAITYDVARSRSGPVQGR